MDASFDDFVNFITNRLSDPSWEGRRVLHGQFTVKNHDDADLLDALTNDPRDFGCTHDDFIEIGKSIAVDIQPGGQKGYLFKDFDHYIARQGTRFTQLSAPYFVHSEGLKGPINTTSVNDIFSRYQLTLEFIRVLKDAGALIDDRNARIILFSGTRKDIAVMYSSDDLLSIDVDTLKKLITEFSGEDKHLQQRREILHKAIIDNPENQDGTLNFALILRSVSKIYSKYIQDFAVYASAFSYNKVKDELESAKIEFSTKIHKCLSDIQGTILGVPVSAIVIATQLKSHTTAGYNLLSNLAVVFGAIVFVILLFIAILNQIRTLGIVELEITRQRDVIKKNYESISSEIDKHFDKLIGRAEQQKIVLWLIGVIALVSLGITMSLAWVFEI